MLLLPQVEIRTEVQRKAALPAQQTTIPHPQSIYV